MASAGLRHLCPNDTAGPCAPPMPWRIVIWDSANGQCVSGFNVDARFSVAGKNSHAIAHAELLPGILHDRNQRAAIEPDGNLQHPALRVRLPAPIRQRCRWSRPRRISSHSLTSRTSSTTPNAHALRRLLLLGSGDESDGADAHPSSTATSSRSCDLSFSGRPVPHCLLTRAPGRRPLESAG